MPGWKRTLGLLVFCQFVNFAAFGMFSPILPTYVEELGVHDPARVQIWVGVIIAANWATAAIGAPLWGGLADRYGKKPMILRAAFGLAAVVTAISFVQNVWQLVTARLLQGAMVGFGTAATALVTSQTPRSEVAFSAGMMQTAAVAGTVVGPVMGGALVHALGAVRPLFLVMAAAVASTGLLVAVGVREERPEPSRRKKGERKGQPALLSRTPVLGAMLVITLVVMFSNWTVDPVLPFYVRTLGVTADLVPLVSGLVFSISGLANVLAAPWVGRFGDRLGARRVLALALLGAAATYGLQGVATSPRALLIYRFLLGIALGGILPTVNAAISRSLSLSDQGRGFGLANSANYLGSLCGPLVGGFVSAHWGQRSVFPLVATLLSGSAAWIWFWAPHLPVAQPQPGKKGALGS